jgi:hypothetical protein
MTGSHRFVMGGDYMRADAGGAGGYVPLPAAGAGLRSGETSTPFTL